MIIKDAEPRIKKETAFKLSRLDPGLQEEAANMLASGKVRSVEQYNAFKANQETVELGSPSGAPSAENQANGGTVSLLTNRESILIPMSHTVCRTKNSAVLRNLLQTSKIPIRTAAARRISFWLNIPASFTSSLRISSGTPHRNTQRCFQHCRRSRLIICGHRPRPSATPRRHY